jgi:DNA-binding LacI/PurR family transcriptional regulator
LLGNDVDTAAACHAHDVTTTGSAREPAMVDVARLAGVSHQTVSRVLNNHPNVRQETARRVRAAIAELNYRPNRAARALVTGRSQLLGVVALNTSLFGPASLLTAFEGAAAAAGFAVSVGNVANLDRASISAVVERHLGQRVAGIVVIAPVASAAAALDHLTTDVPFVTIDGDPERNRAGVTVNQALGAHLATRYLLERGHSTVWHVTGPLEWFDAALRVRGWEQTLARRRRGGAAGAPRRLVGRLRLPRGADDRAIPRSPRCSRQRPPGAGHPARAARAREAGARGPQPRRLRRRARGGLLHPAAHHRAPRLPRGGPARAGALLGQIEAGVPSTAQMMLPPTLIERRSVAAPPF